MYRVERQCFAHLSQRRLSQLKSDSPFNMIEYLPYKGMYMELNTWTENYVELVVCPYLVPELLVRHLGHVDVE